jgi:hypothetical protein
MNHSIHYIPTRLGAYRVISPISPSSLDLADFPLFSLPVIRNDVHFLLKLEIYPAPQDRTDANLPK